MSRAEGGFWIDGRFQPELLEQRGPTLWATIAQPVGDSASGKVLSQSVPFLVDTGAYESCIDADLARELKLPVIDRIPMCGISGQTDHDVVLCQITIPSVGHSMSGRFACVDLLRGGQPHAALLGRDFLKHVVMIYDGAAGRVTIMK